MSVNIQLETRAYTHKPDFTDVSRMGLFDTSVVKSDRILGEVENLNIGDGTVDMWGSDLVKLKFKFLTTVEELFLSSSSVLDTGSIYIEYLDGDFNEQTTVIGVSGQSQVSAGTDFLRINNMRTIVDSNIGNIFLAEADSLTAGKPDDLTKIQGTIKEGENEGHDGLYTVPAGKVLITNDFYTSVSKSNANKDVKISQIVTNPLGVRYNVGPFYVSTGSNSTVSALKVRNVPEKHTQMFEITSEENGVNASFGLAYTLFNTAKLIENFQL